MHFLILQETDWLTRGPHPQHHIFERLSRNPIIKITVIDYDIDKVQKTESIFVKKQVFNNINRTIKDANIEVIRTAYLKVSYLRRLTSLISNFFELLKIIKKNRPDIIIGYSITNGIIGLFFSKLFKISYVFHYIDILHKLVPIPQIQFLARFSTKFLLKYSDQILVYTNFQREYIIKEGAPSERIKILPNGISLENKKINLEKYNNLKSKFSISDEDFVIFFMGYLYEFAGLKEIIEYYDNDIKNGKIKLKFLILGDGGIFNELKNYVDKLNADWVIVTGKIPYFDIAEYISLADLCILNFKINDITKQITPIKIIEYMAMKKPVLSTRLPGVFLEIGENHGVVFVKSQEDLIRKIGELIPQKIKLQEIGQIGYNYVKIKYDWSKIIETFKEIIINLNKNKKEVKSIF